MKQTREAVFEAALRQLKERLRYWANDGAGYRARDMAADIDRVLATPMEHPMQSDILSAEELAEIRNKKYLAPAARDIGALLKHAEALQSEVDKLRKSYKTDVQTEKGTAQQIANVLIHGANQRIEVAEANADALARENARLKQIVDTYAWHLSDCPWPPEVGEGNEVCTCGLCDTLLATRRIGKGVATHEKG